MALELGPSVPRDGGRVPPRPTYAFGPFRLDTNRRILSRDGQDVPLTPKGFDLLRLLVESRGRTLSRQELVGALWPDTFVEEGNLSFQISALRKALGDERERWVATVPKHGYRFAGEVAMQEPSRLGNRRIDGVPTSPTASIGTAERRATHRPAFWLATVGLPALFGVVLLWRPHTRAEPLPRYTTVLPLTSYTGWEGSPSLSPDGTQVAFEWGGPRGDNPDVYVKLVGPGDPVRLTTQPGRDVAPAWSPDGRHIAFIRGVRGWDVDLFVMPALGGAQRQIGALRLHPAQTDQLLTTYLTWTPDSRAVAVGGTIDRERGVWRFDIDGGAPTRLTTPPPNVADWQPAFASDHRRLAFVRSVEMSRADLWVQPLGEDGGPDGEPARLLSPWPFYVSDVDWGSEGRSLIYSTASHMGSSRLQRLPLAPDCLSAIGPPEPLPIGDQATGLDVSPGGRIAYVQRLRDTGFLALDLDRPSNGLRPFTGPASSFDEHMPSYSPDGTRLAFASTRSGTEEIWIANLDGGGARQMTSMGGPMTSNPDWSPDGRHIVFHSVREGSSDLYLLDVATANLRRLTSWPGFEQVPRWSPDGHWIFFGAGPPGGRAPAIYRIPASGGAAERIVNEGATAMVTADGTWIYVNREADLWRVPTAEGAAAPGTRVLTGLGPAGQNFVVGRHAAYAVLGSRAPGDGRRPIVAIDHTSGRVTTLTMLEPQLPWYGLALSPDERTLLVTVILRDSLDLMVADPEP